MFIGKNVLPLSKKNTLALPRQVREALGESAYLTQGFERNLFLLSRGAFEKVCASVNEISLTDPLGRLLGRLFLGNALEVSIDEAGQVELPGDLCTFAGLEGQAVMIGQGEYLELWSPPAWEQQAASLQDFDANAHRFEKFNLSLA